MHAWFGKLLVIFSSKTFFKIRLLTFQNLTGQRLSDYSRLVHFWFGNCGTMTIKCFMMTVFRFLQTGLFKCINRKAPVIRIPIKFIVKSNVPEFVLICKLFRHFQEIADLDILLFSAITCKFPLGSIYLKITRTSIK